MASDVTRKGSLPIGKFRDWFVSLIVSDHLSLKKRRLLDFILGEYRVAPPLERVKKKVELGLLNTGEQDPQSLFMILISDGFLRFDAGNDPYALTPLSFKFEGYVRQFYSIFWRRIRVVFHWLLTIAVSIATSFVTTKLLK